MIQKEVIIEKIAFIKLNLDYLKLDLKDYYIVSE